MNRKEYFTRRAFAFFRIPELSRPITSFNIQPVPCDLANSGSGGPEIEISLPPGLRTPRDLDQDVRIAKPWGRHVSDAAGTLSITVDNKGFHRPILL